MIDNIKDIMAALWHMPTSNVLTKPAILDAREETKGNSIPATIYSVYMIVLCVYCLDCFSSTGQFLPQIFILRL